MECCQDLWHSVVKSRPSVQYGANFSTRFWVHSYCLFGQYLLSSAAVWFVGRSKVKWRHWSCRRFICWSFAGCFCTIGKV